MSTPAWWTFFPGTNSPQTAETMSSREWYVFFPRITFHAQQLLPDSQLLRGMAAEIRHGNVIIEQWYNTIAHGTVISLKVRTRAGVEAEKDILAQALADIQARQRGGFVLPLNPPSLQFR